MGLLSRYRAHLVRRATGRSFLGWYPASAWQSAPWVAILALFCVIASMTVPEPNRMLGTVIAAIPGLLGWLYVQYVMATAHFRDLGSRVGEKF